MHRSARHVATACALVLAAGLGTASSASAYTAPTDTAAGFISKGEVQTAFSWNNPTMQKNVGGVSFSFGSSATYEAVCSWVTGEGTRGEKTHTLTRTSSQTVSATVSSTTRNNSKGKDGDFTGWFYTLGPVVSDGAAPAVGDPCLGGGTGATYTSVEQTGQEAGGLVAHHDGASRVLVEQPAG